MSSPQSSRLYQAALRGDLKEVEELMAAPSSDHVEVVELLLHNEEILEPEILDVLLDEQVADRLGRKESWIFSGFRILEFVIDKVPKFYQNALRIHLYLSDNIRDAISLLEGCKSLNVLYVDFFQEIADLTLVTTCCPTLEALSLVQFEGCDGELKNLDKLESLFLSFGDDSEFVPSLVPYNSSETLKYLCIRKCTSVGDDLLSSNLVDLFPNLQHLEIVPISCEFCDILANASTKLNKLVILVHLEDEGSLKKLSGIFSAPCLESLTELSVCVGDSLTDLEAWTKLASTEGVCLASMIEALTGNLHSVEHVNFVQMGVDLGQLQCFAKMKALKTLTWTAPKELCSDEIFQNELCASEEIVEVPKRIVDQWFQGVFEGFPDKPMISINLYSLDDWEARVIVYDWFLTN